MRHLGNRAQLAPDQSARIRASLRRRAALRRNEYAQRRGRLVLSTATTPAENTVAIMAAIIITFGSMGAATATNI